MDIKENYALNHSKKKEKSLKLNKRLFNTYNRIIQKKLGRNLSGVNIDLGSGDKGFSEYLRALDKIYKLTDVDPPIIISLFLALIIFAKSSVASSILLPAIFDIGYSA